MCPNRHSSPRDTYRNNHVPVQMNRRGGTLHRHDRYTIESGRSAPNQHGKLHLSTKTRDTVHKSQSKDPESSLNGSSDLTVVRNRFYQSDKYEEYFSQIQDESSLAGQNDDLKADDMNQLGHSSISAEDDDDEDDPLDAYMKTIEDNKSKDPIEQPDQTETNSITVNNTQTKTSSPGPSTSQVYQGPERGIRLDIDGIDETEAVYINHLQKIVSTDVTSFPDEQNCQQHDVEYDDDDNIVGVRRIKREIEPLPQLDHSLLNYHEFERNFYKEHSDIQKLTQEETDTLRAKLEIKVSGEIVPRPVCSFAHFNFDEQLMKIIRRSEYTQPTPIQAQAIPAALSGRNLIGIALTGSGKTAAYLWPMIAHIMGQPNLKKGDGPIGLVLVPTRELALQVYGQAKKFSTCYNIAVVCAYGGGSKYEQTKDLEAGAEIVVATPGRLIDLIKLKATNLHRVTYLVLDEADRFFDMGFEVQVKSICDQIRPDRQTLLFSATFKYKTEQLARRIVDNPIKIIQRNLGEVNEDVKQDIITLADASEKWDWVMQRLIGFTAQGSVLIFVTRITNSEELHKNMQANGQDTLLLHGDMEQSERNRVINQFKRKEKNILIATDVAARGLDISHIRTVINYDVARDIDTHIHRIGRTGRAGTKGLAITFITDKERDFAGHLVRNLEMSKQQVSDQLLRIAMQSHSFRKSRYPNKSKGQQNWKDTNDHQFDIQNHNSSNNQKRTKFKGPYHSDNERHNNSNRDFYHDWKKKRTN